MRSSTCLIAAFACASLCLSVVPARGGEVVPPHPITEGLGIDVTEAGFNVILELAEDFIPPDLVIGTTPPQALSSIPFVCDPQNFHLENLVIHTEMQSMTIEADDDSLDLVIDLNLWINEPVGGWPSAGDDDDSAQPGDDDDSAGSGVPEGPAVVVFQGNDWGCLNYVCFLYTDPANLQLRIPISMAMAWDDLGDPFIDVTFGALEHNITAAMQGKIHLTEDCFAGSVTTWLADTLGLDVFDLVLGAFEGEIESQYQQQTENLEPTIEDALRALWLQDTVTVLDSNLSYDLHPTAIDHNDFGLRTVLGGSFSTDTVAECVAAYGDQEARFTASQMPDMTGAVPSTGAEYHFGAITSDDLINQALFALWQGGVMCFVVDDGGGALPMSTDLLGLLLGLENAELLEELFFLGPVAMVIRTVPESPPDARFDGPNDINIQVDGLAIEFYPVMQDRLTRLAAVAIDIAAGIDLAIGPDGAMLIDIDLDTDNLNTRVTYNEIAPELNEVFETNFPGFVGTVINTVGGSLLEGIAMALPTFSGIGATQLDLEPLGTSPDLLDFLGAYMLLGESTGGVSSGCDGCGGEGGCDAAGCDAAGCGADGCGADGCGGEGGCDMEQSMAEAGCSGETSGQPSDTGCQGCDLLSARGTHGHWRATVTAGGIQFYPVQRRFRVRFGTAQLLALLLPLICLSRRRRTPRDGGLHP
jgi:hypothetical protein